MTDFEAISARNRLSIAYFGFNLKPLQTLESSGMLRLDLNPKNEIGHDGKLWEMHEKINILAAI
ncbi:hypothetical protein [Cyclobacterium marinum]|uniref:hypothetical protein n=1 Tax=Cyclobacterium marinum TaxID=104 RepID=UPI000303848A|nr:hypothetical protein [Cyclobacterium marinum]